MDRIVNLQYKDCPKLFKYILKNKRDIILDRWKMIYIHVDESEIENLKDIESLKAEVEKVLNSQICHNCGVRSTGGFLVSYRGQECIGKSIECPVCYNMPDKTFYKSIGLKGNDKYMFVKQFISGLIKL